MANNPAFPTLLSQMHLDAHGRTVGAFPLELANSLLNSGHLDVLKDAAGAKLAAMPHGKPGQPALDFSELAATAQMLGKTAGKAGSGLAGFLKTDKGKVVALVLAGAACGAAAAVSLLRLDPHVKLRTKYGPAAVFTRRAADGTPLRVLMVDGVYQSATYFGHRWNELPFEYYRAFDRMFDTGHSVRTTLMLGGGGFAYPKHLLTTHPETSMDVVEPDMAILKLAMDYFYLDRLIETCPDRLGIFENDGFSYLQTAETSYDAILNDAFHGRRADKSLATMAAAKLVKAHLNPGGLYLVNTVARSSTGDYSNIAELVATLECAFKRVWILPSTDPDFSEEENYLVIASDGDYSFPDAIPY